MKVSEGTRLESNHNKIRGGDIMNANQTSSNNSVGSVSQQARLLMRNSRQRQQNRQANMLTRISNEVGLQ
ncbi:MAG: hypothetical protein IGQ45_03305 [Cyanobacterium sp. T60_A2020_053]|nr:hypothetical protein [Cyanobacterium sp. T60_A2020_053]